MTRPVPADTAAYNPADTAADTAAETLVGFARALRRAGVAATPDRVPALLSAVAALASPAAAEGWLDDKPLVELTAATARRRQRQATQLRLVSVFRRGQLTIWVALLHHAPLPLGAFVPEPWPVVGPTTTHPTLAA